MTSNMPVRNMPVKNEYACRTVPGGVPVRHSQPMERMRELREAKSITQGQLAERVGIEQSHVSKIERGLANPTLDMIRKIAAALGVEPFDLFGKPDLQGRALVAISGMDQGAAEAAVVVLEAMASRQDPKAGR